ncbi:MAG TPA: methyltransferase domain-containing protein [Rhizomicrobium sp.]|jgi:SAM-dependent methyltransferase|nr:methyltransferase domain-containing protein [Rhizomicrobium sp.]
MPAYRDLLACPACRSALDPDWACTACGMHYIVTDGIPDLRLPGDDCTNTIREFYERAPFPGYRPRDNLGALRKRAERSEFARLLDAAIPTDARILEIGCGTGQMSIFLASAERCVIGADVTRASLKLGAEAARRFGVTGVQFVETDLHHPGLRAGAFDVVYTSGVLHHTRDPLLSFQAILPLLRPGGLIVIGLYNSFARIPLQLRRIVARLSSYRWIPFDPILRDRASEPARREAWIRDQYRHPEEHRHTAAEVRGWFARSGVEYVRTYPSLLMGEKTEDLFAADADYWPVEAWLSQIGWMATLGREGGLFVTIGRRP